MLVTLVVTNLCDSQAEWCGAKSSARGEEEAVMRTNTGWRVALLVCCLWATTSRAEWGFDSRYERDYNIFAPTQRYVPDNPLNPLNAYDPDNPFNPVNRYDPGNPLNPINRYNPNNPFNPVNQYHPDNPLNPVNQYNLDVPFAPLNGGKPSRKW
jgi:hypothetical protein